MPCTATGSTLGQVQYTAKGDTDDHDRDRRSWRQPDRTQSVTFCRINECAPYAPTNASEELAALEANRAERVAAAGLEPLEAHDIGIQRDVQDALAKLADGTYGDCETCQGLIPIARLKAVPYARRCLACQEREENGWHPVKR